MTDALARATAPDLLLVTENAVLTRCVGGVPRQTLGVAAAESVNAVLECVSVTRDSLDVDFVRKFVQTFRDYKAGAPPVLSDLEFYSANVMNALSASGSRHLAAVENDGIKKATVGCTTA